MTATDTTRPWWGDYEAEVGETSGWEIGPLHFWLQRDANEWKLAHQWDDDDERADWQLTRPASWPEDEMPTERFAASGTREPVSLRPLPADRSVVARPRSPFQVLPGQRTRIFLSSPLWVEIRVGPDATPLRELPAKRLSDTWFGPTTRVGELSYALKTSARTDLDGMPRAAYRFLTPVVIENRASDALVVERLNLPVPFLAIYDGTGDTAWSEEVALVRTESGDVAELDIHEGPPEEAAGAARLSEPRQVAAKGHLFRAFGSLLGFDD